MPLAKFHRDMTKCYKVSFMGYAISVDPGTTCSGSNKNLHCSPVSQSSFLNE